MPFFKKSLAGPGYIVLNVLRVMNIIGLMTVIAASIVMLVKTFVVSKFFFFDACSHVITATMSTFLILSELPLFRHYFAVNWPLFSQNSGLVMLGVTMIVLGVVILGNLNKQATSQESLGLPFWRIVIASGIIITVLGPINILANYIFRDTKMGVTARQVRSYGAVAPQKILSPSASVRSRKSFQLRRSATIATLPSYHSTESRQHPPRLPLQVSRSNSNKSSNNNNSNSNNKNNEQFSKFNFSPELREPEMAHHPANFCDAV